MELLIIVIIIAVIVMAEQAVYSRFGTRYVSYSCSFDRDTAEEGQELLLTETAVNGGILPVPFMKSELTIPEALEPVKGTSTVTDKDRFITGFFMVKSMSRIKRVRAVRAGRRGVYRVTAARVQTGDILGGVRLSLSADSIGNRLTVLPVPAGEDAVLPERLKRQAGERLIRNSRIPDPFYTAGAREYVSGDSISRIHWKASAHMQELMVRQEEKTALPSVLIILNVQSDSEKSGKGAEETELQEHTIRLCVQCMLEAMNEGYNVTLVSNGFTAAGETLDITEHSLDSFRYALAELSVSEYQPFRQFIKSWESIPYETAAVLITPYTDDAAAKWHSSCRGASVIVSGKGRDREGIADRILPLPERSGA